jgi:hypothetical protein
MNWPLVLAFLWLLAANVIAMFPSRDNHWRNAYALIAVGVPILGLVTWQDGPVWGMLLLAGACSVLRWPLVYLWRRLQRQTRGARESG